MPQFVAIGADAALPPIWDYVFEQAKVLGDHARQQPVLLLVHQSRAAGHEQGSSVLVCRADLERVHRSGAGRDRCAFDEQLDIGVADGAVVAETATHAHQLVSVALGEALRAVLTRGIGLGYAKCRAVGIGCSHAGVPQMVPVRPNVEVHPRPEPGEARWSTSGCNDGLGVPL